MRARFVGGIATAALLLSAVPISGAAPSTGVPAISLRSSSSETTAYRYGGAARISLPVYVQAKEAPFDLRVRRHHYKEPLNLYQVFHTNQGPDEWVELGDEYPAGWRGLTDFARVVIRDSDGDKVYSTVKRFCPNNWDLQRIDDTGRSVSRFPRSCFGSDRSFLRGMAWGIEQGWAVPLVRGVRADLKRGLYEATVRITAPYRELFGISDSAAATTIRVTVKRGHDLHHATPADSASGAGDDTERPADAPTVEASSVDPAFLPDLRSLPAFRMRVRNRDDGRARLEFAATLWTAGNSPLVVEGFRRDGEDTMDAYQYFYDGDEVVGRTPAGTFEYDRRDGHFHWHIQQFVSYRLRNIETGKVVRSRKQSFCLVPTDAVDLSLDDAAWDTEQRNLHTSCGGSEALWIREVLPIGWGDTYSQVGGQAFAIGGLPNGDYWVEVDANPLGLLHEKNLDNNLTRRKVVLKGSPGDRRVIAWNWRGADW